MRRMGGQCILKMSGKKKIGFVFVGVTPLFIIFIYYIFYELSILRSENVFVLCTSDSSVDGCLLGERTRFSSILD